MRNQGRPIKLPDEGELVRLHSLTEAVEDVKSILRKCGAPEAWTHSEIDLIFSFFRTPSIINPSDPLWRKDERELIANNALRFSKMFAEYPVAMVGALPKIAKRLQRVGKSPKSKLLSHVCALHHYSLRHGTGKHKRFWTAKADELAWELSQDHYLKRDGLRFTGKMVSQAREELRKLLDFSQKRKMI